MDDGEGGGAGRIEAHSKPKTCPACGSVRMAKILYGLAMPDERLFREMDEGRTVLGGCCVTGDDPAWKCLDCGQPVHRKAASDHR